MGIWSNLETDTCCDDGWIENTTKMCCCVCDASYPAGRTPGVVCCGQTLCMQLQQTIRESKRGCQRRLHMDSHMSPPFHSPCIALTKSACMIAFSIFAVDA